jgi:hypothetical protein
MYKHLLIFLAAGAVLTGCASTGSTPYQSKPHMSEALNIMRAAGFDQIRDVDASVYGDVGQVRRTDSSLLGGAAFAASSAASPTPLAGGAASAGALGFAAWMLTGSENPAQVSRVLAWVPEAEANSSEAAANKILEVLENAIRKAHEEVLLNGPYAAHLTHVKDHPYDRTVNLVVTGGECERTDLRCGYEFLYSTRRLKPQSVVTPDFIGSSSSRSFTVNERGFPSFAGSTINRNSIFSAVPLFDDYSFLVSMSRHLPEWAMLYVAPGTAATRTENDELVLLPYPFILRQGEELSFIRP